MDATRLVFMPSAGNALSELLLLVSLQQDVQNAPFYLPEGIAGKSTCMPVIGL